MVLVGAPISPGAAGAKRRANVGPCTGKANDSDSDSAKKRLTQKRILANRVASGERCGKRARERERERDRDREEKSEMPRGAAHARRAGFVWP